MSFAVCVNFMCFLGLVAFLFKKPLSAILVQQSENMSRACDEVRGQLAQTKSSCQEIEARLSALSQDMQRIKSVLTEDASREVEAFRRETQLQIERVRKDSEATRQQYMQKTKRELAQLVLVNFEKTLQHQHDTSVCGVDALWHGRAHPSLLKPLLKHHKG